LYWLFLEVGLCAASSSSASAAYGQVVAASCVSLCAQNQVAPVAAAAVAVGVC
jgi:hypothetical protein